MTATGIIWEWRQTTKKEWQALPLLEVFVNVAYLAMRIERTGYWDFLVSLTFISPYSLGNKKSIASDLLQKM